MSTTRIGDFRQTEGDDGLFALAANGSATISPTSARSAYDLIVDDLNNLYTTLLKRSADKPGLDWWASQVSAGNASIADVANEFRNSAEYKVVEPLPPVAAGLKLEPPPPPPPKVPGNVPLPAPPLLP